MGGDKGHKASFAVFSFLQKFFSAMDLLGEEEEERKREGQREGREIEREHYQFIN